MADGELAGRPSAFWDAVGLDYAARELTIQQVCSKYDLTLGQFNHANKRLGWHRRNAEPVDRRIIIKRLYRLLSRMLEKLEAEMTTVSETEVNVLGKLVRSMGKLIDIETATNTATSPRQTKDMHDIRRKLVERIEELKRG
jgi:hypothetical protein